MSRLMLDTNICIHAMKQNEPEVVRRLKATRPGDLSISCIVAGELWTGVMKSRERERNRRAVKEFLTFIQVLDWPAEAASVYGEIRAALEAEGRLIGALDLLIAAHALHEQATLVTRNRAEFVRVEGLQIQSWQTP